MTMAIFGVRVKGTDVDVTTIQVPANRNQKSNAEKTVKEYQRIRKLDADKQYEVHFLFFG